MRVLFKYLLALQLSLAVRSLRLPKFARNTSPQKSPVGENIDRQMIFAAKSLGIFLSTVVSFAQLTLAKPEGVNRPDLLPSQPTTVIDVANFLSKGQEKKIVQSIADLEKSTGFKLRLLCQSYPNTPGLAIKDYWDVNDKTVVLVVDRGEGFNRKGIPTNIINLNIGKEVEDVLSPQFWQRLTNKLGNQPYVKKNGEDIAVLNAVEAITYCLQSKDCTDIPFQL